MQFVITAEHAPEHCPSSNAKIRQLMKQAAKEIPELANRLGLRIITTNFLGPDHEIFIVVEAPSIEPVRDFAMQSRLAQWNTVQVRASWSMEEAMSKADALPTIF